MTSNKAVVCGIYATRDGVELATNALVTSGFSLADISVLLPESHGVAEDAEAGESIGVRGSTLTGAVGGAAAGGVIGLMAGIGALAIPGVGPVIAAGPIVDVLAGMGVGGAIGGFTGAIIGMGIPEDEAKVYEARLKKGGILVSLHCTTSDEVKRVKELVEQTGGEQISSTTESSPIATMDDTAAPKASAFG
jgi:hypothetical protein